MKNKPTLEEILDKPVAFPVKSDAINGPKEVFISPRELISTAADLLKFIVEQKPSEIIRP